MSGGTTQNSGQPPVQGSFEHIVKDFWVSRPRRPQHGRKIAGVAAAVGVRYGIDPVVVRIALVAATMFGGVGLMFYILGWLFFADEYDEVSPIEALMGRGRSSTSSGLAVVLCIALLPTAGWMFSGGGWFDGGGFIGLALLIAAFYLLHRSRGHLNRPTGPTTSEPGGPANMAGEQNSASFTAASVSGTAGGTGPPPSGWDPLGAAPLAWDLPDKGTPFAPPANAPHPGASCGPRSKIGVITFALTLVVGGVGAVLAAEGHSWFTPQHIVGLMLGVVGIGMVAGSLAHGGRGLIWLAIPLSIAGLSIAAVPADGLRGGVGELTEAPRTVADVKPVYERGIGNVELDLRNLPDTGSVSTMVRTGMGNSSVIVPETADVTFTCENSVGNIECFDLQRSGLSNDPLTGTDNGSDGPGGPKITLHVQTATGNVEVRRA